MGAALIVGIDYYDYFGRLHGCANDARAMLSVLERNGDGSRNLDCKLIVATDQDSRVTLGSLTDEVESLFSSRLDTSIFYFAGHGYLSSVGGYLVASDSARGDSGLPLSSVLALVNRSPAKNRIVLLDCCHSGFAGTVPIMEDLAVLADGVVVLAASTANQYASEVNGQGVFTGLLVDALEGGAANLIGQITPGGIYSYLDQTLNAFEQRPVFRANVQEFISIRTTPAAISIQDLRRIIDLFPEPDFEFGLDPSFEVEARGRIDGDPSPDPEKIESFRLLQSYNRHGLVIPMGAPHMWHAAMSYASCRLTKLGVHYHRLVKRRRV